MKVQAMHLTQVCQTNEHRQTDCGKIEKRESENGLKCSLVVEITNSHSEEDIEGQRITGHSCIV